MGGNDTSMGQLPEVVHPDFPCLLIRLHCHNAVYLDVRLVEGDYVPTTTRK